METKTNEVSIFMKNEGLEMAAYILNIVFFFLSNLILFPLL